MQHNNNSNNQNEGREWAYVPWLLSLKFKVTFLEHKARTKKSHARTIELLERSIDLLLSSTEVNAIKKSLYISKNQNRSSKHFQKLRGVHKKIHNLKLANCLQILFEAKHNLDYTCKTPTPATFYLYLYKIYAIYLYVSQILEECIQTGPSFFSLIDKGFLTNFSVLSISSISSVCASLKKILANLSGAYVEIASTMKEVLLFKEYPPLDETLTVFQKCLGKLPSIVTITNRMESSHPLITLTAKPIIIPPPLAVEEVKPRTHPLTTNTNKPKNKKPTEPKISKTTVQQTSPHQNTQPIVTKTTAIPIEKSEDQATSKKRKNSEIEKTSLNTIKKSKETKVDQQPAQAQSKKQSLLNNVFDSLLVGVKH